MININQKRQILTVSSRRLKRQESISLKRKSMLSNSQQSNNDVTLILKSLSQHSVQQFSKLSQISKSPEISKILMSEQYSDQLFLITNGLENENQQIVQSCLIIIGHLSYNCPVEQIMQYDIMGSLVNNLQNSKQLIRQLSIWILSNIAGQQQAYATSMLNNTKLMTTIQSLFSKDKSQVKNQILYFYKNLVLNAQTKRIVQYLSQDQFFITVKSVIKQQTKQFQQLAIQIFRQIILIGEQISQNQVNIFTVKIDRLGLKSILQDFGLNNEQMRE